MDRLQEIDELCIKALEDLKDAYVETKGYSSQYKNLCVDSYYKLSLIRASIKEDIERTQF